MAVSFHSLHNAFHDGHAFRGRFTIFHRAPAPHPGLADPPLGTRACNRKTVPGMALAMVPVLVPEMPCQTTPANAPQNRRP
jgi:hypothetical protein